MNRNAWLSDELRLMLRPFQFGASLASSRTPNAWDVGAIVVRWLLLTGVSLSFLASGHILAYHVAFGAMFWAFLPAVQSAALFAVVLTTRRRVVRSEWMTIMYLHFAGYGPFHAFFLLGATACVVAPDPGSLFFASLGNGTLLVTALLFFLASVVVTFATIRVAVEPSRRGAALICGSYYVVSTALVLLYFAATGQLLPIVRHAAP